MARGFQIRPLRVADRAATLAHLERDERLNLSLIDLVCRLGEARRTGEPRPELLAAFRERAVAAVAALQPAVMLDSLSDAEAVCALLPHLAGIGTGLVKSEPAAVEPVWKWLSAHGRRALLDRMEVGFALEPERARFSQAAGVAFRRPGADDLDAMVLAARASLLEERRPDPALTDPTGFRRWVRGRLSRALLGEASGQAVFVGYADVRSPRGWLLQGIYTWPDWRRRGVAAAGVSALCGEAFAAGASHVQLAVVEGNEAAERLYRGLGFERFARLRTLLFG